MSQQSQLSPALQRELDALGEEGKALAAQMEAQGKSMADELYPEPTLQDINEDYDRLKQDFQPWRTVARSEEERRYLRDKLPQKWQKTLQEGRRFYSRLSHNEIMRVAALQCANNPKIEILPAGDTQNARDGAIKESRWSNQLLPSWERATTRPLRRRWVDGQNAIGLCALELYVRDGTAYDTIGDQLDPKQIMVPDDNGTPQPRMETNAEVMKRTEGVLMASKSPIGARFVHGLSLYYEEDDDGVVLAIIAENKPRKKARQAALRKGVDINDPGVKPGTPGRPVNARATSTSIEVETLRYYTKRHYAWVVDGKLIEVKEHKLPGVPVFPFVGMITSSSQMEEAIQGICWGMESMELTLNDLMTLLIDMRYTYSRPKWVVETPLQGQLMMNDPEHPRTLDFTLPGVPELNPGQELKNALDGFQQYMALPEFQMLLDMWQRSGLNAIAMGESPGSSPAGYTVNSLSGAAQLLYMVNLNSEAATVGRIVDFSRLMVRDTIRERVYQAAPMADSRKGGTEWIGLSPDEVTETCSICTINPNSPQSQMAKAQSLMQANKAGFVPRAYVQREAFGAEDPQAWDDEIAIDIADDKLILADIDDALMQVRSTQPPPPQQPGGPGGSGLVDQHGNPLGPPAGTTPAAPNPPTVGPGNNERSQVSSAFAHPGPEPSGGFRGAQAGQANHYVPLSAR